ncbi:hypothetical protein TPHA_0G01740 [Tetrapisispora phaffii CBS 4417]|uniref:Uncharacterized protein n=1 Tax=Tetrapisispora phaffii (strain ATCC 24235 / CBS 4417 / NBRC 1672 / NRRL Y-8282 / UCD 70-5) TaxID=1071381 RepID=G8BVT2_TETPH|nr:hypothetical protein TPHA_0G01740 [Tetrapisispora phaffii CBS 4417]CCE64010.1 hypothetical protein TPHA_0G01740 [Tetrapisispora phaffii CBS 4417]
MTNVWKKGSSTYQHISSFKPTFQTSVDNVARYKKSITFSDKVLPDSDRKVLETSLLYSQGKDIYELPCELPIDTFLDDDMLGDQEDEPVVEKEAKMEKIAQSSTYGQAFNKVEKKPLVPKWTYQGETINKITYLGENEDNNALVMASSGSLAWFKEGVRVPVHIMQEYIGPGTSYSSIHTLKGKDVMSVCDFALSVDFETVVKSQSQGPEGDSILKLVDNAGKPGELLRKVYVPGTTVTHSVRFFDNHVFGTCSDDNVIRFWDTRTGGEPTCVLSDPNNGALTSFDVSPVIDTLFVTGSDTGIVKLWDIRSVTSAATDLANRQNGEEPIQDEVIALHHSGGDSVVDVKFSPTSPSEFVSIGGSGDVYHWDLQNFFSQYDDDSNDVKYPVDENVKANALKFLHTGGSRRSLANTGRRNVLGYHSIVSDLIATVDEDSLITVYKPYVSDE